MLVLSYHRDDTTASIARGDVTQLPRTKKALLSIQSSSIRSKYVFASTRLSFLIGWDVNSSTKGGQNERARLIRVKLSVTPSTGDDSYK